jgi:lipid A 3-O-deacylase
VEAATHTDEGEDREGHGEDRVKSPPHSLLVAAGLLLVLAAPGPAAAQGAAGEELRALRVGFAYFDVDGAHEAGAIELVFVPRSRLFWRVHPQMGGVASSGGTAYVHGGLVLPLALPGGITASPSLGAGFYRRGEGPDLGSALEFRSGVQLDFPAAGNDRIAVYVYHLSNASLADRNPGTEVVGVGYVLRW